MSAVKKSDARIKRKKRVRKKVRGLPDMPRLCVFRSSRHIYAQIIDDTTGRTLISTSSLSKGLGDKISGKGGNKEGAKQVGADMAQKAIGIGIKKVVFDRNGFLYHGRVKALSEAARENGLVF
ncbi:50S ribosomal subunit protein L18 [uncultured Desulfobacterium sp.]|uniref:Large ribosomal subunit protein uL18 n=1 Tax=uncultured Desulfobacterium sp. TaxID=201089 RepID=A0A445MS57_9BACT|nr:50S ribosomal subunit protein L18 [uncultured Desulfobacterium sp.]